MSGRYPKRRILTLTEFFAPYHLEAAWEVGPKLRFESGLWAGSGSLLRSPLYHFMKRGPVIVRPGPDLAAALMDTEIRVPVSEYRQPFPIMGVVDEGRLVMVWHAPPMLNVWAMHASGMTYFLKIGNDLPTIPGIIGSWCGEVGSR